MPDWQKKVINKIYISLLSKSSLTIMRLILCLDFSVVIKYFTSDGVV